MDVTTAKIVIQRITALEAERRHHFAQANPLIPLTPAFDFLNDTERKQLHEAQMALPSSAENMEAARLRISERIKNRKAPKGL